MRSVSNWYAFYISETDVNMDICYYYLSPVIIMGNTIVITDKESTVILTMRFFPLHLVVCLYLPLTCKYSDYLLIFFLK